MAEAQSVQPDSGEPKIKVDFSKITDEDSAAQQLAGVFAGDEGEQPQEDQQPEPSGQVADGAEPEAPSAEADASQPEPEIPAIVAPVSWTADEKQLFAKLPPETQQVLLRRESERDRGVSERIQKATEQANRLEAAFNTVANERAQAQSYLQSVILQVQPDLARFQQVDWVKLASENPAEWARAQAEFNALIGRQQVAQQQIANLQQQQAQDTDKRNQAKRQEEDQKLLQKVPELADQVKAQAFVRDIGQFFGQLGFSQQEMVEVGKVMSTDHRLVLLARDAMLYRQQAAARQQAQAKRVPNQASNVRSLRPAARSPTSAQEDAKQQEIAALHGNLAKTGSIRDATALLEKAF